MNESLQILLAGLALMILGGGSIYLILCAAERACAWLAGLAGKNPDDR